MSSGPGIGKSDHSHDHGHERHHSHDHGHGGEHEHHDHEHHHSREHGHHSHGHHSHEHGHHSHDHHSHEHGHHSHGHGHEHHSHDHDHDHGHDGHGHHHGRSVLARVRHGLSGLFGLHSHDHADSMDDAFESSSEGIRTLVISFSVLMATAVAQVVVVYITGSVALLADTIHNFADASTAIPLFIAFRLGRRAPTRRYTYGYRRAEDLAGLFVVLVITISAVVAGYQAIERLINPRELEALGVLFAAGMIGFIGNEWVAVYRVRTGRRIGSAALVADGLHARVDGLTSLAVALAAVLVWLGWERADPVVGLAVSIAIFAILRTAARDIYRRIMDAVDPELVQRIEDLAGAVPGVDRVTGCQVRWMGHRLRADIAIAVDGQLTVSEGHAISHEVAHALRHQVRHLDTVFVHTGDESDHHPPT